MQNRLSSVRGRLPLQLGGPIGTGESLGPHFAELRVALARQLGLGDVPPWQSDRTEILGIAQPFALVAGTTAKIGQDLAPMAQTGTAAVRLAGGDSSSAMVHKQNSVGAEVFVAIGRFNAGLFRVLGQSMLHENEYSGAAWTLEWMLSPEMAESRGQALAIAADLPSGAQFATLHDPSDEPPSGDPLPRV